MDDYEKAIHAFYTLKSKYEKKERKRKKEKPPKEKKCINCKKQGGTNFLMKNNIIKASCNCKKKCKLNIEIKITKYITISEMLKNLKKNLNIIKEEIILLKLDNLFNIKPLNETNKQFKSLKKKYNKTYKKILNLENYLESKKEDDDDYKHFYTTISKIKSLFQEYSLTQNHTYLKDILEIYIEELIPQRDSLQINNNIYSNKKGIFRFVKQLKNIENEEIVLEKGNVISNIT